jgi:NADH:ubiquinone oxidoreductase subunit 4 (subunit M)
MLMPEDESLRYRIAGIESLGSYGVIAVLVFLLLLLGIYPAPVMSIVASVSAYL